MNQAHDSTISVIYHSTVLMVGFSDNVFNGSESSGRILVRLLLSGGTSATPVTATFTAGMTVLLLAYQLLWTTLLNNQKHLILA